MVAYVRYVIGSLIINLGWKLHSIGLIIARPEVSDDPIQKIIRVTAGIVYDKQVGCLWGPEPRVMLSERHWYSNTKLQDLCILRCEDAIELSEEMMRLAAKALIREMDDDE